MKLWRVPIDSHPPSLFSPVVLLKSTRSKAFPIRSQNCSSFLRIKPSPSGSTKPQPRGPAPSHSPGPQIPPNSIHSGCPGLCCFSVTLSPFHKSKGLESVLPSPQNVLPQTSTLLAPPSSRHLFRCCPLRGLPCPAFLFSRALSPSCVLWI